MPIFVNVGVSFDGAFSLWVSLNTYLRASGRQERLSGIALMHINYDVEISVDRVMSIFVKKPRALEFPNICSK